MLPTYQYGYILPVQFGEFMHYNFYQVVPDDAVMVAPPLNLQSFSGDGVEAAFKDFWRVFDFLVARKVDRITQGGIPISARLGRKRTLAFMEEAARRSPIPCQADFEESIDALKMLGAKKVGIAAKWEPSLMHNVKTYLEEAGFQVVGVIGNAHTAGEVISLTTQQGHEVALELARGGFKAAPAADALLLAGGAWQNLPAVIQAEQEDGRPIVTNPTSSYWAALKQFGLKPKRKGFGALLDSLF